MKANNRCKQSTLRVCFSKWSRLHIGHWIKEEISIGPGDGLRLTYMNAKLNHKCNSELIDLLKEVMFRLMGCLTWVDRSFNHWYEKFYVKGCYPSM